MGCSLLKPPETAVPELVSKYIPGVDAIEVESYHVCPNLPQIRRTRPSQGCTPVLLL